MTESDRIKYLRVALRIVGLIFIFGIWSLTIVWPSGWAWHAQGRSEYLEMILGVYATLGLSSPTGSALLHAGNVIETHEHRAISKSGVLKACQVAVFSGNLPYGARNRLRLQVQSNSR